MKVVGYLVIGDTTTTAVLEGCILTQRNLLGERYTSHDHLGKRRNKISKGDAGGYTKRIRHNSQEMK